MRYDFVYENNNGEKINLSKLPYKINIEPLIDYSWSYKTKQRQLGNKIVGFFKDIKDSTATLHVLAATATERDEAIDYFNNVIEKDIYYGTAGKLWLGDWYTYAFITASKNSKWQYDAGIVKKEITISKEADSWYHITRSANYGEQEESTVYIAEDYIKTYEGREADSDIKSLVANIVPQQSGSGTPSPDNVREISGWESVSVNVAGKNAFSGTTKNNKNLNGSGNEETDYSRSCTTAIKIEAGEAYTVSYTEAVDCGVFYYDKNNAFLSLQGWASKPRTFTPPANTAFVRFSFKQGTAPTNIQVELGTTATAYEPYTATTHTTSLGRTVYGGTVDVVSGTLTVDRGIATFDGSSDEPYVIGSYGMAFRTYLPNDFKPTTNNRELAGLVSNQMTEVTQASTWGTVGTCAVIANTNQLYFKLADDLTDISELRTYLASNPLQVCYELATPTTYQLTPQQINTLAGVNNVWANSGDVTVTFRDDHGDIQTENGSIVTFEKKNALSGSGYDYAYDYMHDAQSQKIIANAGSIPCDFIITIQGYADSPIITIGDNTYAVNVEVPYGANLVIDSTQKTVIITLADGTKINAFGARDPDYYLFERIESGKNAVTWDGSYLWELLMIEERSEPRWLTD